MSVIANLDVSGVGYASSSLFVILFVCCRFSSCCRRCCCLLVGVCLSLFVSYLLIFVVVCLCSHSCWCASSRVFLCHGLYQCVCFFSRLPIVDIASQSHNHHQQYR